MSRNFDYTNYSRKFAARFPVLNHVLKQISFWVIANMCLTLIVHFVIALISPDLSLPGQAGFLPSVTLSIVLGILYGTAFGFVDFYFEKQFLKGGALGKVILLKTTISLILFCILFALLRFWLFDLIIVSALVDTGLPFTNEFWKAMFNLFLFFYFLMGLIINFINQVNKKFGPGVLIPLLLGKYRNPKEEERIFMFMDLKSSTTIAEALGHLKYSGFIRDSFMDINQRLSSFDAQVYQYVGDEIVLTWNIKDGLKNLCCVKFFFACEKQFADRKDYYMKNYGLAPEFKAGLHIGKVTVVEIGEIKRDIAYHGDTLNTAARIQSKCNEYEKKFLISEYFLTMIELPANYKAESLGKIVLKGKTAPVGIASIEYTV